MKPKKAYHPNQPYKSDGQIRPRKASYNSRLPKWIQSNRLYQTFNRMSHKRKLVLIGWSGISALVIIGIFTTVYFASTLGSKQRIMNRNNTGVTLVDQNNQEFYHFFNARSNTYVPLKDIAPIVQKAAISSEDKDFYSEPGFSPKGIAFAMWQNVKPGGSKGGGSTITQQLVASSLLNKKRSLLRKYQELVLSIEIERRYNKNEILEMYLNSVYFGEGAFGIEDAAQTYFGKSAKQLDMAEASLLIGLLPAPSAYSPISGDPKKAKVRQKYVLGRLVEDGKISSAQKATVLKEKLSYSSKAADDVALAPHFALMVKDELINKYGEEKIARSGYRVKTSINLSWQAEAEAAVNEQVQSLAYSNVSNGAAVAIDPRNGEIRLLVGSINYNNKQFGKVNMATASRQPGSSFKPFVYSKGIEDEDFSAATIWHDVPTDFGGGYEPKNYDLTYHGDVTTRRALANSFNIPAVAALQKVGINNVIENAANLGITTLNKNNNYGLSLALGSAQAKLTEMTGAYSVFANAGFKNDITTISSITDKNNKKIYTNEAEDKPVISPQTSYIMSSILSDNTARAETFGNSLTLSDGRPAAVKTGTTENYRDAWTIGYTPAMAVGVWIGNNDNSPMNSIAGSLGAAPIWRTILEDVSKGTSIKQFTQPGGLTVRSICRYNGALAQTAGSNTMTEYFIPGTLPTTTCNQYQPPIPPQVKPPKKPNSSDSENKTENGQSENSSNTPPNDQNNNGGGNGSNNGNGQNNPLNPGNSESVQTFP